MAKKSESNESKKVVYEVNYDDGSISYRPGGLRSAKNREEALEQVRKEAEKHGWSDDEINLIFYT